MEDAASLAIFLNAPGPHSIETRLEKWNDFRYGRACTIQQISIHGGQPLELYIDVIKNKIKYTGSMPETVTLHDRPVQEWFLNYDVRKEARAFIAREAARPDVVAAKVKVPHQHINAELVHRL